MFKLRSSERLARATLTMLIVFGLVLGQAVAVRADDKLGKSAIDSVMDQYDTEPVEEPTEPAADDGSGATETAPDGTGDEPASEAPSEEGQLAAAGDESAATDDGISDESASGADDETASGGQPAQTEEVTGTSDDSPPDTNTISAAQAVTDTATEAVGNVSILSGDGNRSGTSSLAQVAASNVLSGGAPLGGTHQPAAAPAAAPVEGGLEDDTALRASSLQTAGNSLRPSTIAPRQNRNQRAAGDADDNGTVVVNSLSDAGDQGKLAVHGHLVAGTLCDGSQFWSLDGGGTVNANGVNLSANGGTSLSAAGGGDDNGAAGGGAAGNGGSAHSSADGGIVVVDELVTGNNRGNEVTVGDQAFTGNCGSGVIDGGDVTTVTNVNISADGGTAIADATGGDNNFASGDGAGAGNGGRANASADGGIVIVGSLILGNNEGNQISAGGGGSGSGGCWGGSIDGGNVLNQTTIDISADGGIAIADATGGDDNIALGEDASAGNGGRARANADGGLILAGDIVTGNNQGNSISVECGGSGTDGGNGAGGRVVVNGGSVLNQTNVTLNADGGTAIADASGGDDNVAGGLGSGDAAAGNGGRAESDASGGFIQVGNIVSGNNVGNVIALGANFAPVPAPDRSHPQPDRHREISAPASKPSAVSKQAPAGRATQSVGVLPNTGTGSTATVSATNGMLLTMGGTIAVGVAVAGGSVAQRRPRSRLLLPIRECR